MSATRRPGSPACGGARARARSKPHHRRGPRSGCVRIAHPAPAIHAASELGVGRQLLPSRTPRSHCTARVAWTRVPTSSGGSSPPQVPTTSSLVAPRPTRTAAAWAAATLPTPDTAATIRPGHLVGRSRVLPSPGARSKGPSDGKGGDQPDGRPSEGCQLPERVRAATTSGRPLGPSAEGTLTAAAGRRPAPS